MRRHPKARDCATSPVQSLRTLAEVVRDYRRNYSTNIGEEAHFYGSQTSLRAAVSLAARARTPDDKRHPHQRRIPEAVLRQCEAVLLASLPALKKTKNFDALFELVRSSIGDIRGVGELLVYDTSTRVGAFLGLHPTAVYLHAGVRRGAQALGLVARDGRIELKDLPKPLSSLDGASAEDILCIYKDSAAFRRIAGPR